MSEDSDDVLQPPTLDRRLRRVLGVLVEKAFCTPESYPLTLNAIIAGCNQKSNREPVVDFKADTVESSLEELKDMKLVECVFPASGRTERWKHVLVEAWDVDGKERALLGELMLRGPQTEGELRTRASRMTELTSLDEVNTSLANLAGDGFVKRLSPESQKRGVVWMHLFYPDDEAERVQQRFQSKALEEDAAPDRSDTEPPSNRGRGSSYRSPDALLREDGSRGDDARLSLMESQLEDLRARFADLSEAFDALSEKVERITG